MKKRLWISLCTLACLTIIFCLGFLLAELTAKRSFDRLPQGSDLTPPVHAGSSITVFQTSDHPGLSNTPITAEQAKPGRKAINALRGQTYTRLLFSNPQSGGIAIYQTVGCSSECFAYWDGTGLWLYNRHKDRWQGYRPAVPNELNETLESLAK